MSEIKLTKRFPESRPEDITEAYMWGYEAGRGVRETCEMLPTHSDLEITLTSTSTGITRTWGYRQCSNCLCNVFEGANYCPNCGARVEGEER